MGIQFERRLPVAPRPSTFVDHVPFGRKLTEIAGTLIMLCQSVLIALPAVLIAVMKRPSLLLDRQQRRRIAFGSIWRYFGPSIDDLYRPYKTELLAMAEGVVIDIGSGTGQNLKYLSHDKITRLVLIEFNSTMYPALTRSAIDAGFEGKFEILGFGAEDAHRIKKTTGLTPGSVDTVISVLALCGIPQSQEVIDSLYEYLKPGGQFLFFEHCASPHEPTLFWQRLINPIWTLVMDGCELDRPTGDMIINHEWTEAQVWRLPIESRFSLSPKEVGFARK
ncbi:uncharacterized protein L969DRAFT_17274 [Mixia osmundae IAM 14324]|uniref:Methyltransferase type 11 domain-containing protein n=1 Tax=Mixia osmundae (strain CBS 9802 / IAM 14324 / JCM 22182 / KY 12970) TaxID=764103 RepID=G7E3F4_MIXOS|nr:uncharacterized protein L969DRAFT_17274 [Mixia osmundae IAM 14324]KEI39350.1 hypothetical protein L969DRAFT_17274 [Mixia osmundae IAM 14324]GAA97364.1 hypothetical protein E5Q_04042 [Mixia osmundae IAM 14324]